MIAFSAVAAAGLVGSTKENLLRLTFEQVFHRLTPTASKHWRQLTVLSPIRESHCRSINGGIMLQHFWESPTGPVLFVILFNWVRTKGAAQCRCRLSDASTDDRQSPGDDLSITAHRWQFTYFTSVLWQLVAVSAVMRMIRLTRMFKLVGVLSLWCVGWFSGLFCSPGQWMLWPILQKAQSIYNNGQGGIFRRCGWGNLAVSLQRNEQHTSVIGGLSQDWRSGKTVGWPRHSAGPSWR